MNCPRLGRLNPFLMLRIAAKRGWKRTVPAFALKNGDSATRHSIIPVRVTDFSFSAGRSEAESPGTACEESRLPPSGSLFSGCSAHRRIGGSDVRELACVHDRSGCANRDQPSRWKHPALKPRARCPIGDGGPFFRYQRLRSAV
jgi:hypothetical protein